MRRCDGEDYDDRPVLSGLPPALQGSRAALVPALKSEGLAGANRTRLRNVFVVAQITVSLVLIVAAGLLLRALDGATDVDPGFDDANVDVVSLDLSLAGYMDKSGAAFIRDAIARAELLPHIEAATAAVDLPLDGGRMGFGSVRAPGVRPPADRGRRTAASGSRSRYTHGMQPRFTPRTLSFLRALKRNNRREWFNPRKDQFERDVRAPMVAVVEQLAQDFRKFAPELEASPKTSIFRIYRDTRFSEDKSPYKTHIAAAFRVKAMPKGQSAGMYVEVTPGWVWMGGGYYAPETPQLVKIREHISDTFPEIRRITQGSSFKRLFGALDGEQLARVPRGFAKDDPAAEYLRYRSFLVGREFPPEFATKPAFYPTLVATFKAAMPLVRFLIGPLTESPSGRKPSGVGRLARGLRTTHA